MRPAPYVNVADLRARRRNSFPSDSPPPLTVNLPVSTVHSNGGKSLREHPSYPVEDSGPSHLVTIVPAVPNPASRVHPRRPSSTRRPAAAPSPPSRRQPPPQPPPPAADERRGGRGAYVIIRRPVTCKTCREHLAPPGNPQVST